MIVCITIIIINDNNIIIIIIIVIITMTIIITTITITVTSLSTSPPACAPETLRRPPPKTALALTRNLKFYLRDYMTLNLPESTLRRFNIICKFCLSTDRVRLDSD